MEKVTAGWHDPLPAMFAAAIWEVGFHGNTLSVQRSTMQPLYYADYLY